jgi:alanine racemase
LTADVIETVAVVAEQRVGYHGVEISQNGTLVMIGCGSAHGVAPLADNLSPFHFSRQRMQLIEAPHMHTSMCFIPSGQPTPVVGDQVDVQRPLITTSVDRVDWL